jgi:hypothetical protein
MFFLKTCGGWRENQTLHIGGDGEAPPVKVERVYSWRMRPDFVHYQLRMMSDIKEIDFVLASRPTDVPTKKEPVDFEYEPREAFLPFHERTQHHRHRPRDGTPVPRRGRSRRNHRLQPDSVAAAKAELGGDVLGIPADAGDVGAAVCTRCIMQTA